MFINSLYICVHLNIYRSTLKNILSADVLNFTILLFLEQARRQFTMNFRLLRLDTNFVFRICSYWYVISCVCKPQITEFVSYQAFSLGIFCKVINFIFLCFWGQVDCSHNMYCDVEF